MNCRQCGQALSKTHHVFCSDGCLDAWRNGAPEPVEIAWDRLRDALNVLRDETYGLAVTKGWHEEERNFGELIALAHSELSEALECYRDGWGMTETRTRASDGKLEGVPSELADVVIRVLAMAGYFKIDIGQAIVDKHAFNATRPHRHGGKKA